MLAEGLQADALLLGTLACETGIERRGKLTQFDESTSHLRAVEYP